jgi:hypothetical protein
VIAGRGGEEGVLAAEASPAGREDEVLVGAFGVRGVGIEAADEALGFGGGGEGGLHGPSLF